LDFDEMVSAPKCRELKDALIPMDGLKARMAERAIGNSPGLLDDLAPVSTSSRHRKTKIREDLSGNSWNIQRCSVNVQGHSQYATSDVSSNRLRIDKMRRCDDNPYANVGRKVHVRHNRNLLNIGGAPEALDRPRHLLSHWRCQPSPNGGQ
jgi:hypothetical protein